MKTSEALRAAWALIEDPANWTTEWFARDRHGRTINAMSTAATCWCALGALQRACPNNSDDKREALRSAARSLSSARLAGHPPVLVDLINDGKNILSDGSTGHEAVGKIYAKAIADAEAMETAAS